ncbi:UNVERIFIED_CONTAM: hypothetical protein NCL1_34183 [Trichonephila clavipes]
MNGGDVVLSTVKVSKNMHVISVNVTDIIDYILETLLAYAEGRSKLLGKHHVLTFIPSGDFNIDFDEDERLRLAFSYEINSH